MQIVEIIARSSPDLCLRFFVVTQQRCKTRAHLSTSISTVLEKRSAGQSHTLRLHERLKQEDVPRLDKLAQLSSRLHSLHLLESLLDRTPGMDQTLRSLEFRELDLPSVFEDSIDIGVTLLAKCDPKG